MHIKLSRKAFLWRVKIVASNGRDLLVSETYFSKHNAQRAARKLSKALGLNVMEYET